ncbi:probable mediator of DNA damage checkpoint protein 1 at C-terminar half [Coccomyxa sp. Obi]|nr:probable mediator of DNA damage checkpoint protein 1 at C-terminar half [Coccomyxa sp. Obi]
MPQLATLVEPTQVEMQQATQLQTSPHSAVTGGPGLVVAGGPSRSPTRAMGGPDVAAAGVPSSRSPTRAMGDADVAAAGGPSSRSPTRSRTTRDGNLGDDYDEGDSIWLPALTGALASQQEVMSPPKEDALPARLAGTTSAPAAAAASAPNQAAAAAQAAPKQAAAAATTAAAAAPGPIQLPMEPLHAVPHPELQAETQLAEPSLGQEFATQNFQVPNTAAAATVGGSPAGGTTQAQPSGSGGGGFSLQPILPGSADAAGTPRIGAGTQEENLGGLEPDSDEGTLQIAPSRRSGRMARVLADTQDTLGLAAPAVPEQAVDAAAPEQARETAEPEQAIEAAAPEQARDTAAPRQVAEAGAPEQATVAAAPEQARDTAVPGQATEAAVSGQATEAAAPEQATEAAAPDQATEAAAPEQTMEAAAPEQATEAAAPEQATSMAVAAGIGPGGWRVKKKPAPRTDNAPADAPSPPVQHGSGQSGRPNEGVGDGDLDFKAHVEKKTILSPRQEYVPSVQQAQLQASSAGWKRKGVSSSQNPSQSSELLPVVLPASPPAAAAAVAAAAPPGMEGGPSPAEDPPHPQQAAAPEQARSFAAVTERTPARPLWQDLLSDFLPGENILPGENASSGSAGVLPQQPAAEVTSPPNEAPPPEAHVLMEREASDTGAGTAGTVRRGARRLPASVRAARQATIPDDPGPDTVTGTAPAPDAEVTGVEDTEQRAAGLAEEAQAAAAKEAAAQPRSARGRAPSARGRSRGRRPAAAAAAKAARNEAAPEQAVAAEAAPHQVPAAAEAAPNQAAAAAEAAPDQATAAAEAAPNQAATPGTMPDQASPAEAAQEGAVPAGRAVLDETPVAQPDTAAAEQAQSDTGKNQTDSQVAQAASAKEEATREAAPKRGRGKATKASAAAATQPDTLDVAGALVPDTEAAVFLADHPDEHSKEARPSGSMQKVFSRRGRRPSSAAAAVEEAAAGTEEAASEADADLESGPEKKQARAAPKGRGRKGEIAAAQQDGVGEAHTEAAALADTKKALIAGKVASSKGATVGLTESQTAAHTLAQVRAGQGQAPRVSPVPKEAAPATAGRKRGRGSAIKLPAAKHGRADRDRSATAADGEEPEEAAAEEGPKQAAAEGEPKEAAAEEGPAGPRGKKRGRGQRQAADDVVAEAEVAKAARPAKRGRASAAAAAKRSEGDELQDAASAGGDKKGSAAGRKGRMLARKLEVEATEAPPSRHRRPRTAETEAAIHVEDLHASAMEGPEAAQTSALRGGKKQPALDAGATVASAPAAPAARHSRAAAAAAAESPPAEEAAAQPPASKKRGSKKRPMSEVAATTEAAATGAHIKEEQAAGAAVAPSRKRGRHSQSQAPSQPAGNATEAVESTKGKGRATKPAKQGTSAAATGVEAAQETAPALKRARKSATERGSQAEEAVTAQEPQPEVTAAASGAAGPAPKRGSKSAAAKGSQAEEAVTTQEPQPEVAAAASEAAVPAPKRGRKSAAGAAAAARAAASQAAEAGPPMQLRGTDAKPPRVLVSTCVDAKLRQSITKTVERLGGTITASAQDFTVFVTLDASGGDKDRGFTKSLNALSALASGSPIVSEKWVDACGRSDAFVSAKEFLLKDPAAERKFGFSLAAAFEAAQQSLLLDGVHVFLTPGLVAAEADKGEGLRMLVRRAGGNVAETVPKKLPASGAQWLLLGDEKSKAKEAAWAKKALKEKGIKLHGRSALINGLMTQRLDRDADVLLVT